MRKATQKLATECNNARQANLKIWLQSLDDKAKSTTESNALRARCIQAEADVTKLKGEIEILKQMSTDQEDTAATSAVLRPFSFYALSGIDSGLVTQASPQLGGGMSGLGMP